MTTPRVTLLAIALLLFGCKSHSAEELAVEIKRLSSKNSRERNAAALSIAGYGEKGEPAVKALKRLLKDENGGVRSSAAYALRSIGTKDATAALDGYEK